MSNQPYVLIVEEPDHKVREYTQSIYASNSEPADEKYPTIKIMNYSGCAIAIASCVSENSPYIPHPHELIGTNCKKGVCTFEVDTETMKAVFAGMRISITEIHNVTKALEVREQIRVDPFRTGFTHKMRPYLIDFKKVRLCFQVFLAGSQPDRFTIPLSPVISDVIIVKS